MLKNHSQESDVEEKAPIFAEAKKTHTVSGRQIFLKRNVHFIQPYHNKYRKFRITNLLNSILNKNKTYHETPDLFRNGTRPLETAGGHNWDFPRRSASSEDSVVIEMQSLGEEMVANGWLAEFD